jgi:hypothetical protein
MIDPSLRQARWSVVRACESSRHQRQLLAQAYQQVFPQARQSPSKLNLAVRSCGPAAAAAAQPSLAARVAAGA